MTRGRLRHFGLICALLSAPWGALGVAQPSPTNVLVVTIDTLRADRLGSYGYEKARTPHLDRLASEGIRFARAFTVAPLTLPAHCTLFTGTYPPYHGVRDNSGFILPAKQVTLAEIVKQRGYETGAFIGAFVLDSKFGLGQGFDEYFDDFDLSGLENVSPGYVQRPGNIVVDHALDWLSRKRSGPFFAWVHLYDPHDPYDPPEDYAARHRGSPYDGEVEFADAQVGRLIEALRTRGELDRTLVVVVGDHGESLGDHQEKTHGFFLYNSVLHVPLLFRLPGAAQAGTVVDQNVSLVDVFPTVGQVLRLDRSSYRSVQGRGRLGLILGRSSRRDDLYAETFYPRFQFGWSQLTALIRGDRKLIMSPDPELYDLEGDFPEVQDLADREGVLAAGMKGDLAALLIQLAPPEGETDSTAELDSETMDRLASLGYLSLSLDRTSMGDDPDLLDPKSQIGLYNRLGRLFEQHQKGDYQVVIPEYQKVLAAQPELKLVRYKLGQAFYHTGQFDSALEAFKEAIRLGGEEPLATFDLAMTYFQLRKYEEAAAGFERTLSRDPRHLRALINLGVALRNLGRSKESVERLEEAVRLEPEDLFALSNLGVSYSVVGRHDDAVRTLRLAVGESPKNAMLHANLSLALRRMGRRAEADEELAIARKLNPDLFKGRPNP